MILEYDNLQPEGFNSRHERAFAFASIPLVDQAYDTHFRCDKEHCITRALGVGYVTTFLRHSLARLTGDACRSLMVCPPR
jgi:hypothetical protein